MRASDLAAAYAAQLELENLRKAQERVRYLHGGETYTACVTSPDCDQSVSVPLTKTELVRLVDELIIARVERLKGFGVIEQ